MKESLTLAPKRFLSWWGFLLCACLCTSGLWAGGTASFGASGPKWTAQDDTIYVATADPVVVTYEGELDTLVVRPEDEAGGPVTAGSEGASKIGGDDSGNGRESKAKSEAGGGNSLASAPKASLKREQEPGPSSSQDPSSSSAASPAASSPGIKKGIAVAGLIIDRTHSVVGRDFQDAFHGHWKEPEEASSFTIRIAERPLPQFGSQIRVAVGETTVFQSQLRPGSRQIERAARQAATRARYYLREFYEPREVY